MTLFNLTVVTQLVIVLLQKSSAITSLMGNCNGIGNQSRVITVLPIANGNETHQHSTLQEALDYIMAVQNSQKFGDNFLIICLPEGHHTITKQIKFYESSIALVGTQATTVECDYDPFEEGFDYTWHFNQSKLVHLESIMFTNCPLPYRVIAVRAVVVWKCTFRYVFK